MPAKSDPRAEPAGSEYYYRRSLSVRDTLPVIGVALAAGLAAFYLARLFFERTPLVRERGPRPRRPSRDARTRGG